MATSRSGGYSTEQFESEVNEMFKCLICTDVLKEPVELSCQHLYCKSCILQVLRDNPNCPQCRVKVQTRKRNGIEEWIYHQPKRYFINVLSELRLKCDFNGCQHISTIEAYANHQSSCEFNPNGVIQCPRCKSEILRVQLKDHDCVNYLLEKIKGNEIASTAHIATLERASLTKTNMLEKQAQQIQKQAQQIQKQSMRIVQLENQNESGSAGVSELQSLSSKDTVVKAKNGPQANEGSGFFKQTIVKLQDTFKDTSLVSINCKRRSDNAERTIIVKQSDTIQNICDQFSNKLEDGDKFDRVRCIALRSWLDLNKTVKDYGIRNRNELYFFLQ